MATESHLLALPRTANCPQKKLSMAFVHLGITPKSRGIWGAPVAASCGGRLVPQLLATKLVGHTALGCGPNAVHILRQNPSARPGTRGLPNGPPSGQLVISDFHVDCVCLCVDHHHVTISHEGNGTAILGFGDNMADNEAVGTSGKPAIGDQGHIRSEACPHKR
jgi:hypothetical protein